MKRKYISKKEAHFAVPAMIPMLSGPAILDVETDRDLGEWSEWQIGAFKIAAVKKVPLSPSELSLKNAWKRKRKKKKGKLNEYDGITGIVMKVN